MAGFELHNYLSDAGFFDTMGEDVLKGLTSYPKSLPPKYFYDERGSELFEEITELEEYYPMKTEASILESTAAALMAAVAPAEVLELGSGSSTKTRVLLDAARGALDRYIAFDVSESIVRAAAEGLRRDYPRLDIVGVIGDFQRHLDKVPPAVGRRLVLFLGSTIGNLHSRQRVELLSQIRSLLQAGDHLLIGMDLVKDAATLEFAYNDAKGITAAFNQNMLNVINQGLGADFRPEAFVHKAIFNSEDSRIEMHLQPREAQSVHIDALGLTVELSPEETIWTESSYKFTRDSASDMLGRAGLTMDEWYTDARGFFALVLCSPASESLLPRGGG